MAKAVALDLFYERSLVGGTGYHAVNEPAFRGIDPAQPAEQKKIFGQRANNDNSLYKSIYSQASRTAGHSKANPSAAILTTAMMLRHLSGQHTGADRIRQG